jgi:5-methyltetrahydropteroyltriglutamate--homocysteine methyltransferase
MARMLCTHVGSLPRPQAMVPVVRGDVPMPADWEEQLRAATAGLFAKQIEAGLDIINDGEISRRDYVSSARARMSGFGTTARSATAADLEESTEYAQKFKGRKGLLSLEKETVIENPSCDGEITYLPEGLKNLEDEIERITTVIAGDPASKAKPMNDYFFSSPSPGTLTTFFPNSGKYYKTHEEYVRALGKAMKTEYERIAAAGFSLQVDCPDLAMGRHTAFKHQTTEEFKKTAALHVEVMNEALANIPADQCRVHVCWGNYPGPHDADVPLADVAPVIMTVKPKYISLEACNPGHAHEWEVFKTVKLPSDKVIMPGVLDTTTAHIEHPRLVAQRLLNYVRLVGLERVMACTDCGFSTAAGAVNVVEELVWKKMRSMVEGAKIATREATGGSVCRPLKDATCLSFLKKA